MDPNLPYQLSDDLGEAVTRRDVQRNKERPRRIHPSQVRVRFGAKEDLQCPHVSLHRRRVQGRRLAVATGIDVCPFFYEKLHDLRQSVLGADVERREPARCPSFDVCAGPNEGLRDGGVSLEDGEVQSRDPAVRYDGDIGPLVEEERDGTRGSATTANMRAV